MLTTLFCGFRRYNRERGISRGPRSLQDEGSQLVAELVPRGGTILDCCAAPGGKTLILANAIPDARIVACESSPQRLAQLRERLAVLGDRVECRLADVTSLEEDAAYDAGVGGRALQRHGHPGPQSGDSPPAGARGAARQRASARFFVLLCAPSGRADL